MHPSREVNRVRNRTRSPSPRSPSPLSHPSDSVNMVTILPPSQGDPFLPSSQGDNTQESSASSDQENNKRKWQSEVWDHYIVQDGDLFPDKIPRAICKYCTGGPLIASSSNGTSNFKRHTESCAKRPVLGGDELAGVNTKMTPFILKEKMALAVIRHAYPFTFAEHEANRDLHKALNKDYDPICRNTLKKHCIIIHRRERKNIKELMGKLPGRICLTTDMWTSNVGQGYLSLTAHYIDSNWTLQSKILNFCHMEPPHDAPAIHEKILGLLKRWDILKKVFTITLDNARCNDNMQDLLLQSLSLHSSIPCDGEYFHVRCGAHILNLIVQEGLKVIDSGVHKLRNCVRHISHSERRTLKFKENALALGIDCSRGLCLDCVTRWNATHKMLDRGLIYRTVFPTMRRPEMQRFDPHFPEPPTLEEWERIEKICELLKPFDDITTLISGRKYPTANLYLKSVWKIQFLLTKYSCSNDEYLKDMATRMRVKFDKYWENYSLILSFAAILDPRYKLPFIKYCFHELEPETAESKTKIVKDEFFRLYEEYVRRSPEMLRQRNVNANAVRDELPGFAEFDGGNSTRGRSALDTYLDETRLNHTLDMDILIWWEENGQKYPIVAEMARDILAIPITTVASESAFSMGSRVLTKWRGSLHPDTADALITTRSWIFGYEVQEGMEERQDVEGLECQVPALTINAVHDEEDEYDD